MHVRNWELSLPPCRMLICFWSGLPLPTPGRWKCWGNACVLKKAKKKVVFVQWLSPVQLFATPWTAACQAPLASTISQRLLKFMSIESVMLSDHLILRLPFSSSLLSFPALGSFPMSQLFAGGQSIGVSASASVLPMNIQDWCPLGWTDWISLQSKGLSTVFSNTTVQKHQFFNAQSSLWSKSHIHIWLLEKP